MTLPSTLAPLARRWPLVLIGTVLAFVSAFLFAGSAAPSYSSSASVLLLPGRKAIPEDGNVFLFMGNLFQARDVVVQSLGTEQVAERVLDNVPDGTFSAVADETSNAPILIVTVTSPNASGASDGRDAALDVTNVVVRQLQDQVGTAEGARFRTLVLSAPAKPDSIGGTRTRGVITVSVLGIAFTLGLVALVDLALRGRARRRSAAGDASGDPDPRPAPTDGDGSSAQESKPQESVLGVIEDRRTSTGAADSDRSAAHNHRG